MTTANQPAVEQAMPASGRAPRWLIFLTVVLTLSILVMAVAETTLWTHYLIDLGEQISLLGLAFILIVGLALHRSGRLLASLPLTLPWLIYPIVTQGDQIIDNLTINQMRIVVQFILAILFATPIAVLVLAARHTLAPPAGSEVRRRAWTVLFPGLRQIEQGRLREGAQLMTLTLLLLEIWVAYEFLGKLMVLTLIGLGVFVLFSMSTTRASGRRVDEASRALLGRRLALVLFLAGTLVSAGLYFAFKNRPGSYQGSPHHFHDASQADARYPIDAIAVPAGALRVPDGAVAAEVSGVLEDYGNVLRRISEAYYILDRNYNYAFHNELFMRNTPVLPEFRTKALDAIEEARQRASAADGRLRDFEHLLSEEDPLLALLREVRGYVTFTFRRAATLEAMSGEFEQTRAGLQHATHIYEGEGKILGVWLMEILDKHAQLLKAPELVELTSGFVEVSGAIHDAYANRIVGF